MQTHTIISDLKKTPEFAAIDAIEKAKNAHGRNTQAVHIICANLILINKQWRALFSVVSVPLKAPSENRAIIFGHLPAKYSEIYDDLLNHVDHLNIIDDDSIWQNIKNYLLDIYFYQAVHFKQIERIHATGGGYFKEVDEHETIETDFNPLESDNDDLDQKFEASARQSTLKFQKEIQEASVELLHDEDEIKLRNFRENKKIKNLTYVLNKSFS